MATSALLLCACGTGTATRGAGATAATPAAPTGGVVVATGPVADPAARARAGGWNGDAVEPPPHYCSDEGGTEWCDGARDDDCDGLVDEGCVDCVNEDCVRYTIRKTDMQRGAGRTGSGACVGPVYCGRNDGYATTSPPGGCGAFHCGTVVWGDRTAQPNHCTIYGRCVAGEFVARGFTW